MASIPSDDEATPGSEDLIGVWLGRRAFEPTLEDSLRIREGVIQGRLPGHLLLVEHPPVLTMGRRASREDILWSSERLEAEGVEVAETPRGGEVTLHAPGQLVAYPIVRVGKRIREHIVRMAETSIELLEQLGVPGTRFRMEHPGVWLGEQKLGSIGIHVSRGVTVQGLSLNIDVDPKLFGSLVSCGLSGVEVVSVTSLAPDPVPSMESLAHRWGELFAARAGLRLKWGELPGLDGVGTG